jgi:hypothetical protein
MFLTLQYLIDDEPRFITFDGSPHDCQTQANSFIGEGLYVNRIILIGEK